MTTPHSPIGPIKTGRQQERDNDLALSFIRIRQAVGALGYFLPLALIATGLIWQGGIEPSISDFFYTSSREIFVGTLCAIAVFLWNYEGYKPRPGEVLSDFWVARVTAVAALGVALFPTTGPALDPVPIMARIVGVKTAGWLHIFSALVFFVCLAIFCIVLFRRGAAPHEAALEAQTRAPEEIAASRARKLANNRIYLGCGLILAAVIVLLLIYVPYKSAQDPAEQAILDSYDLVFIFESVGVFAFATAWLVKGKTLGPLTRLVARTV